MIVNACYMYWKVFSLKINRTVPGAVHDSMKNASGDTQFHRTLVVTVCLPFQDDRLRL